MKFRHRTHLVWLGVTVATWVTAVVACNTESGSAILGPPEGGAQDASLESGPPEASVEAEAPEASAAEAGTCALAQGEGADGGCDVTQICVANQCRDKGTLAPVAEDGGGLAACTNPPCINVYNNCTIPLWTQAVGSVPIDEGNVRELQPNTQFQYSGLSTFGGGRLYAYYQQPTVLQSTTPVSFYNQYIEMSVTQAANDGGWIQNYDISYVDSVSLPVSVQAENGCEATRCGSQFADWVAKLQECPTELRYPANGVATCMGSYDYCISSDDAGVKNDDAAPYCTKMQIAHGYSGSSIYGGYFPNEPSQDVTWWDGVSAWNRGTFGGDTNVADYYAAEPYNDYAKMIHVDMGCRATSTLEGVFAYSTDDHQNQAGFVECASSVLDVVWCPYQAQ